MTKPGSGNHYKSRVLELETFVSLVNEAMLLVPIEALEQDYQWHPSIEALQLLRRVRGFARSYAEQHSLGL